MAGARLGIKRRLHLGRGTIRAHFSGRGTLPKSKSLISVAGSWCSLVSTLDCQSRGRGFKSRRARHFSTELRGGRPSRSPETRPNSPDHCWTPAAGRSRVPLFCVGCAAT